MISIVLFSLLAITASQIHEQSFCSRVGNFQESLCMNQLERSSLISRQGLPGKRGPIGEKGERGLKGRRGVKGSAAAVNYNRVEEMISQRVKEELQTPQFEQKVLTLLKKFGANANIDYLCDHATENTAHIWNGTGGVFDLRFQGEDLKAYCDLTTENGSWLVFQRRMDGSVNFYRNWADFVNGFGDPAGEHWLGLETIHNLVSEKPHELRIELEDWEGNKRFAKYSTFRIGDARSEYRLEIGGYSGNAGESIIDFSNGMSFTTIDNDNDGYSGGNCAVIFKGAWWHKSCHESNLNGKYLRGSHSSYGDGVEWEAWRGYYYSLKFTEMKIRPIPDGYDAF